MKLNNLWEGYQEKPRTRFSTGSTGMRGGRFDQFLGRAERVQPALKREVSLRMPAARPYGLTPLP